MTSGRRPRDGAASAVTGERVRAPLIASIVGVLVVQIWHVGMKVLQRLMPMHVRMTARS